MDTINDVEKYTLLPSTGSMIIEMMIVITLFFAYIFYISYLSAYGTGFKPNFVLFIDMLFDRNNDQRFQTYIQNVLGDKGGKGVTKSGEKSGGKVETFQIKTKSSAPSSFFENIQISFFHFISQFYISGHKIYISKKDVSI